MPTFILMTVLFDPKTERVHAWNEELSKQDQMKRFPKPADGSPFLRLLQRGQASDVVLPLEALTMYGLDHGCAVALLGGQDNAPARARVLCRVFEKKIIPHYIALMQGEINLLTYRLKTIAEALSYSRSRIRDLGDGWRDA